MTTSAIQFAVFISLTSLVGLITYLKCRVIPHDTNQSKDYFLAGGTLSWPFIAGFKLIIPLIVLLPGIIAFKLYGDVGDVAYGQLVNGVLPSWLSGAFAAVIAGAVLSSFNSCLNSASALYTCDLHQKFINKDTDIKKIGQRVALLFTVVSVLLVPMFENSDSIIAMLQKLNGLYSMPVLAIFLTAILFKNINGKAARFGLLFGAFLYAIFTFVWSPLHYIHLMFITLVASIGLILLLNKFIIKTK